MEIINYISKYIEEIDFFNDQKKLYAMSHIIKGLTCREIAEKIDKKISYVQKVMDFLRNNNLLCWGKWSPNVYKIGMKKSIAILDWKDRKIPEEKNFIYTTYAHHVQAEKAKVLVIYTYPKDEQSKIEGKKGELITPFYYTFPQFTVPFFKNIDLFKKFKEFFPSAKNDKKILSATPSFKSTPIDDNPISVYICRCCQLHFESGLMPGIVMEYLKQDIKKCKKELDLDFNDLGELGITYTDISEKLRDLKKREIIFPLNGLYLKDFLYQSAYVKIITTEIYKIMATFNKFNILTGLAMTEKPGVFYLYIHYPSHQFPEVMEILNDLDPVSKVYIETKHIINDTICYEWALKKYLKSKFEC